MDREKEKERRTEEKDTVRYRFVDMSRVMRKPDFCIAITEVQVSYAVTDQRLFSLQGY